MGILLSFAPFILYALMSRSAPLTVSLFSAAALAAVLLLRDHFIRHRSPKLLEIGTVLLFGGLGIYVLLTRGAWSIPEVRLAVDGGLLLIVVFSMLIRQPFTLQYAREQAPKEFHDSPRFLAVNQVLTAVWGLAFALMAGADLIMARLPQAPLAVGVVITVVALAGAAWFTGWYPNRLRRLAAQGSTASRMG
jgi:hypothetical protein